jgi:hypothetical protein
METEAGGAGAPPRAAVLDEDGTLILAPGPHEVAVARVPAGTLVRAIRAGGETTELRPFPRFAYVQVPGSAIPWGAMWCTWDYGSGITRYRHHRDRAHWATAQRYLAPRADWPNWRETPRAVYVVHEQVPEYGRPVWRAVRVRREDEE